MAKKYRMGCILANVALVFLIIFSTSLHAQTTLHYWSFNSGENSGTPATSPIPSDISVLTGSQITHNITDVQNFAGTPINAEDGYGSGGSFVPRPGTGLVNNGESFEITFSTVGYEDIAFSFAAQRTATGFDNVDIELSVDGGTIFTMLEEGLDLPTSWALFTYDLSNESSLSEDNGNVIIRITLDGGSGATGNNRYDNIKITGSQIISEDQVATPVISPAGGTFYGPVEVTLNTSTDGATIYYTTDGSEPTTESIEYTASFTVEGTDETITVRAFAVKDELDDSQEATAAFVFPAIVDVTDIANLRAGATDGTVYRLTGEAVVNFAQSFRNQKWIQDESAAILIDDNSGNIEGAFTQGDGITNVIGTLSTFNNTLQIVPVADASDPFVPTITVEPTVITMSQFIDDFSDFESQLVTIEGITFTGADGSLTFSNGTVYEISDGTLTGDFRATFFGVDYIGDPVPVLPQNITGILNERTSNPVGKFISARNADDFEELEPEDPTLFASPGSLSGFSYVAGAGPSDSQSFSVSGSNLDGSDVSVTAPGNFEVSLDNSDFSGSVTLTAYDGSPTDIWVRLEEALSVGAYSGDVTVGGGDADPVAVAVSGEVTEPPVTALPFSTVFNIAGNWFAAGSMTAYNEKFYIEDGWFFNSTHAVRGGSGESFGGSAYSFRDRGLFTVINLASVTGMTGFRFQLYDWMTGDGVDRDLQISFDGGETWETVLVVNKGWFNESEVYQPFVYYFEEAQDFVAEEFQIRILNPSINNNVSRMNIGQFEALDTPEPASVEIAGNAGWRMLSIPVSGATVADLAAQNQVQGIAGIADFYGEDAPEGIESDDPNIFTSYETGWNAPDNVTDVLENGKGLLWYFYNNDQGVSTPLPFTLTATGESPDSDVTTSLHTSTEQLDDGEGGTAQVAFNLLGNPFAADLDISGIGGWVSGGSLNSIIVQVWKNDEAGWQEGVGHQGEWVLVGGGNNDDKVAAWQGFMVENSDATSIEFPASARTDGATFLKEQKLVQKRLVFTLEG